MAMYRLELSIFGTSPEIMSLTDGPAKPSSTRKHPVTIEMITKEALRVLRNQEENLYCASDYINPWFDATQKVYIHRPPKFAGARA